LQEAMRIIAEKNQALGEAPDLRRKIVEGRQL
jgi:hypothetical protein